MSLSSCFVKGRDWATVMTANWWDHFGHLLCHLFQNHPMCWAWLPGSSCLGELRPLFQHALSSTPGTGDCPTGSYSHGQVWLRPCCSGLSQNSVSVSDSSCPVLPSFLASQVLNSLVIRRHSQSFLTSPHSPSHTSFIVFSTFNLFRLLLFRRPEQFPHLGDQENILNATEISVFY